MRSELFGTNLEAQTAETFTLQNSKMLRVALRGEVLARQGSMVAYQGRVEFDYEGSGGVGRFIKKALTGEGVPLMRCRGEGDLFLAHDADEVHLVRLEQDALTVNGPNVLAFEPGISWDIRRVDGATMFAGGLFNTVLSGSGWVAITAHGTPVVLQTDALTYVDAQSAVAWSANLHSSIHHTVRLGAMIGRGSGEAVQIAFSGQGFVIVQASEGPTVPPHSHGQN
ncbi:MAG TPA: AIM24 family protein [Actinomycetes bacterium]